MSAIAGILYFGGAPAGVGCVERITGDMASSGPDGVAHRYMGPIALGHCMLRTTSEARDEVQPLANESESVAIVMEGRLDNRADLIRTLKSSGFLLRSESDAELVLRAYEAWGSASPEHLLGDFAYAIWDARRQQLLCAVDSMGGSRLYYCQTDSFFAFASTDEALLALPGVSNEPSEQSIAGMLVPCYRPVGPPTSWLKDIMVMLPGQRLGVTTAGRRSAELYWRFEPAGDLEFVSDADVQAQFLDVFSEAVRCRLRASGPVAQTLSGGLDSAAIRAMVAMLGPEAVPHGYQTYSAISDDPASCKESRCIQSLARGVDAHFVSVPSFKGSVSSEDLVAEAWSGVHPCDNSIMLIALMCLGASRNGTRVMLHGASGDVTTMAPAKYIARMMRAGSWRQAWAECRHASMNNNFSLGVSPGLLFLSNAWTAAAPAPLRAFAHRLRTPNFSVAHWPINPRFAHRLALSEHMTEQHKVDASSLAFSRSHQEHQSALLRGPGGPSLGLGGYAKVGRRYGMEMRDPWGDRRVAEFFLRMPVDFKVRQGWTKYLARVAFGDGLAPEVAWRRGKEHLGWLFTRRLMDESKTFVGRALEVDMDRIEPYVDVRVVRRRLGRFLVHRHPETIQSIEDREFLYEMTTLTLWLNRMAGRANSG